MTMWPTILADSYLKEMAGCSPCAMEFFAGRLLFTTLHKPTISLVSITPAILSTLIWTAQPTLSTFSISPFNSFIYSFFLLLTHLPALSVNSPFSPLSFGITKDDSRTNKIPTAHFSLFTFLPYRSHYKPRVLWHTKACVFSKPINDRTCNISRKQIPTFLHRQLIYMSIICCH